MIAGKRKPRSRVSVPGRDGDPGRLLFALAIFERERLFLAFEAGPLTVNEDSYEYSQVDASDGGSGRGALKDGDGGSTDQAKDGHAKAEHHSPVQPIELPSLSLPFQALPMTGLLLGHLHNTVSKAGKNIVILAKLPRRWQRPCVHLGRQVDEFGSAKFSEFAIVVFLLFGASYKRTFRRGSIACC